MHMEQDHTAQANIRWLQGGKAYRAGDSKYGWCEPRAAWYVSLFPGQETLLMVVGPLYE